MVRIIGGFNKNDSSGWISRKKIHEAEQIFEPGDLVSIDPDYVKAGEKSKGRVQEITDSGYVTVKVGTKSRIYHISDLTLLRRVDESSFNAYLQEKRNNR